MEELLLVENHLRKVSKCQLQKNLDDFMQYTELDDGNKRFKEIGHPSRT